MASSTLKFNVTVEVIHPDGTGISRAQVITRLLEMIADRGPQHDDLEIVDIWATGLGSQKEEPSDASR